VTQVSQVSQCPSHAKVTAWVTRDGPGWRGQGGRFRPQLERLPVWAPGSAVRGVRREFPRPRGSRVELTNSRVVQVAPTVPL
jgi:hypothetical protein